MAERPERLDDQTVSERLAGLTGWTREGDEIRKEFTRSGFPDAIAFVVHVGFLAEKMNHHPDIDIRWRNVHLALSTHDAGGLSTLDFDLAAQIDEAAGVIFIVVIAVVLALCVALVIAVAKNPGPSPAEVALGYEHAWDLHDFDVVYRMSAAELHEGKHKADYIAAKRSEHHGALRVHGEIAEAVAEAAHQQGDEAVVLTRLTRRDGTLVHHEVRLARRARAWEVVGYRLRPTPAT